ncbi:undecaprenyl-diphosphatase [Paenibacillus aestuarii]|uniref:Undecaprenyl-diphosphatase n=1 Tax=Paenibacillus aestuarii TaxID=516965 RepID=A0ABW0KG80_9BACL|nr:undecaprenyl-diphosphatase [Paenibacillus aestuarii]
MSFNDLDYQWFQWINQYADSVAVLNPIMRFLAQDAEYLFYLGVIVYWFTRRNDNRRMVAQALLSACVSLAVSGIIGHFFYRDRPFVTHHVLQLIAHPANASFPSDHATGAFVIATSIWLYHRKAGKVWLALAACIAVSRVWTGVHYPTDVLAGALLGLLIAVCMHQWLKSSTRMQAWLSACITIYEKIEMKVWPRTKKHSY